MTQSNVVESELEHLARRRQYILHRAPCGPCHNRVHYFVCDRNDTLLYPLQPDSPGASADEARQWLLPKWEEV